ncbi:MAG: TonB-dependent receptor domain-containing protein [Terracidiphilus sp.]
MRFFLHFPKRLLFLAFLAVPSLAAAQTATLHGQVQDPSGAVVPGAAVSLTQTGQSPQQTKSGADGRYVFRSLAPGSYEITATAKGFAALSIPDVALTAGQTKELNLPLQIAVEQQEVLVTGENHGVSISPDQNASSMVIKGGDLDALSDDPTELQNELQALAGPAAGPNGGQIYIDGFEGGQIPPKSSILEIRVNQNPFSAEYDRIGYGRIEIITKPGSQKFQGSLHSFGNTSVFNTGNPVLNQQQVPQPSYYLYSYFGDISGPITKTSSYFFNAFTIHRQNSDIIDALNPATVSGNIIESFPAPMMYLNINPRVDFQVSKNNFISIRDSFNRYTSQGNGVGTLNLTDQATSTTLDMNELQIADTWVINPRLLMEPRFLWRRISNNSTPSSPSPTVTVQGAFTTGGASAGVGQDHQDIFMLQNYGTATLGPHTLRFGVRLRSYRDANYSTTGENGTYLFNCAVTTSQCSDSYQSQTPAQYTATVINNPVARALVFDGSLFIQDDWRLKKSLLVGLGVRYEGQNFINDHNDWAPRIAFAWTPGHIGKTPPKTVIRGGYGWFYNRFIAPSAFNGPGGTPYIIEPIHDNLINQRSYVVANPNSAFPLNQFNSSNPAPIPASTLASAVGSIPTYHSIDSHFHSSIDMQSGIGVDRQFGKHVTSNVTYLYTQGVHQYLTNNVTVPFFDESDYTITGAAPTVNNYQYQSGGFYRQSQLIVSSSLQLKHLTLSGNYTFNHANSDTQGVNSFPSVAQDPGFDYGRASFSIRNRAFLVGSYTAPHGFVLGAYMATQSGTPYNLTIGNDLTENNQYNARPAFGTCGDTGVVSTQYGCLDTDPSGKNEPIVPFNLGTGPSNTVVHVRFSKVIGIGPKIKTEGEGQTFTPNQGGGVGGRGLSSGGPSIRLDAAAPRRYNLTLVAGANNLFNIVNWGTPNGVLLSPLFNKTQSLAGGQFGSPVPGNRSVFLQGAFSF